MNDPQRLAYLAGVIDASQAIQMFRMRSGRLIPRVRLSNWNFSALHLLPLSFGGELTNGNRARVFSRTGHDAVRVVRLVRPYLHATAAAADSALEWAATAKPAGNIAKRVPCPTGCGGTMTATSKVCRTCWEKSQTKPARKQIKTTASGEGYVEQTAPGRIVHRMLG